MSLSRVRLDLGAVDGVFDTKSIETICMTNMELRLKVLDQAHCLARDLGMVLSRVDLIHRDGVNYLDLYDRVNNTVNRMNEFNEW